MEETDHQETVESESIDLHGRSGVDDKQNKGNKHQTIDSDRTSYVMDEQKIELSKDLSINAADVLCGRGKLSYNHGTNSVKYNFSDVFTIRRISAMN